MSQKSKEGFDCLAFKWRVQERTYEEIEHRTAEEQILYFRRHSETGPFADLVKPLGCLLRLNSLYLVWGGQQSYQALQL